MGPGGLPRRGPGGLLVMGSGGLPGDGAWWAAPWDGAWWVPWDGAWPRCRACPARLHAGLGQPVTCIEAGREKEFRGVC